MVLSLIPIIASSDNTHVRGPAPEDLCHEGHVAVVLGDLKGKRSGQHQYARDFTSYRLFGHLSPLPAYEIVDNLN